MARTVFNAYLFVLVVVRDGDRYLLVEESRKGKPASWYLPAGGVEQGESIANAAVRETLEEAGVEIALDGILGMDQSVADDEVTTRMRVVFLAHVQRGIPKTKPDHHSLRAAWHRLDDVGKLRLRDPEVLHWLEVSEQRRDVRLPQFECLTLPAAMRKQPRAPDIDGAAARDLVELESNDADNRRIPQAGAIPFRRRADGVIEILLIRRRDGGQWNIPKGLIDPGQTAFQTAATEALEEAGVTGEISSGPLGNFEYRKYNGVCSVQVFTMQVMDEHSEFREQGFRERRWFPALEAAAAVRSDSLRTIIKSIAP